MKSTMAKSKEFTSDDKKTRVLVEYDPEDGSVPFAVVTVSDKQPNGRFKVTESVAIPKELLPKVCFALGATEWEN